MGGIQLVLIGDVCQLPPVYMKDTKFFFEASSWPSLAMQPVILHNTKRHSNASELFLRLLETARIGQKPTRDEWACIKTVEDAPTETILVTATNENADKHNSFMLEMLNGEARTFAAEDQRLQGPCDEQDLAQLAQKELHIKVGALVRRVAHTHKCNVPVGDLGTIVAYQDSDITVKWTSEKNATTEHPQLFTLLGPSFESLATRKQYPFVLSWAATIHAVQGMTLAPVALLAPQLWAWGQLYVALSRAPTADDIVVVGQYPNFTYSDDFLSCRDRVLTFLNEASGKMKSLFVPSLQAYVDHLNSL